jgi:hypothetical protein
MTLESSRRIAGALGREGIRRKAQGKGKKQESVRAEDGVKVRERKIISSETVVQLQRPVHMRQNGVRKAPQFLAETSIVHCASLMHHDLGTGCEAPCFGGYFHFEGIDSSHIRRDRGNGNDWRVRI